MRRRIRQHWLRATIRSRKERYAAEGRECRRRGDEKGAIFHRGAAWAMSDLLEDYDDA